MEVLYLRLNNTPVSKMFRAYVGKLFGKLNEAVRSDFVLQLWFVTQAGGRHFARRPGTKQRTILLPWFNIIIRRRILHTVGYMLTWWLALWQVRFSARPMWGEMKFSVKFYDYLLPKLTRSQKVRPAAFHRKCPRRRGRQSEGLSVLPPAAGSRAAPLLRAGVLSHLNIAIDIQY